MAAFSESLHRLVIDQIAPTNYVLCLASDLERKLQNLELAHVGAVVPSRCLLHHEPGSSSVRHCHIDSSK